MKPVGLTQDEISALFAQEEGQKKASAPAQPDQPRPAVFPNLEPGAAGEADPASIGLLAQVELEVTVLLGQTRRNIREILSYGPGSVLELDRLAGEAVDILVNGRLVARGEVVVIGENFGVRVTELVQGGADK